MDTEKAVQIMIDNPVDLDAILPKKHIGFGLLKEEGFTTAEVAKMLGLSRQQGYNIQAKLDKHKLTNNTKLLKLAHSAVKNTLQGKSTGDAAQPKTSDVIAASQMVYDRVDPIKRADQAPVSISFTQINLEISNDSSKNISKSDIPPIIDISDIGDK